MVHTASASESRGLLQKLKQFAGVEFPRVEPLAIPLMPKWPDRSANHCASHPAAGRYHEAGKKMLRA